MLFYKLRVLNLSESNLLKKPICNLSIHRNFAFKIVYKRVRWKFFFEILYCKYLENGKRDSQSVTKLSEENKQENVHAKKLRS